jgi:16S rRNA (cytosine967-C5)-methyltransferase
MSAARTRSAAPRPPRRPVAPARECAYAVLRRVSDRGAFADRALDGAAAALDRRDRALATRLVYGTVQRRATLDHVAATLAGRTAESIDAPLRDALRLGLYQLLFLDSVPAHAAVDESVTLAKRAGGAGFRLVNALLRRAADEGAALVAALDDETPERAAVRHSVPPWIAELWWEQLGATGARALLATVNEPAENALRANTLVMDAETLAAQLPVAASITGDPPEAVVAREPLDVQATQLWREGACMPQSRASMIVAHAIAPHAGERVLDLCAAPGAKTTHIAALMNSAGEVVAVERHRGRAAALIRTATRMHATNVTVEVGDATNPRGGSRFDRVLLDPPCSGLGTLRSRPDLRWRVKPDDLGRLAVAQEQMLSAAAEMVSPQGSLVYSTCTISTDENERQIAAFLERDRRFELDDVAAALPSWSHPQTAGQLLALPHVQGSDGFYVARLRRR